MTDVQRAFKALHPRKRWILQSWFGLGGFSPMTMVDMADLLEVTSARIWALKERALLEFKTVYRIRD